MPYRFYKRKTGGVKRKAAPKKSFGRRLYSGAMKGLSMAKLAGQTAKIIRDLNVEKKDIVSPVTTAVSVTADNAACINITPVIEQGIAGNQRIGNSCKLTRLRFDLEMVAQSATENNPIRFKWYLVRRNFARTIAASVTVLDAVLDPNPFSGNYDTHALRDRDNQKEFTIVKTGYGKLAADSTAAAQNDVIHRTIAMPLNDKLIYLSDVATTPLTVSYHFIITVDKGTVAGANGLNYRYAYRYEFVDN